MIVPRHKICDICKESVGINNRYYIIKSKNTYVGYAGSISDNRIHHICEDCMASLISLINEKEKDKEKNER